MMLLLLAATMVVINATLNLPTEMQSVPIDVQITPLSSTTDDQVTKSSAVTAATANQQIAGLDIAAITGIVTALGGVAGGAYAAFKKNSTKVDAVADSTVNLKESLKATDLGSKDSAELLARVVNQLASTNPELSKALENCKPATEKNAKEWSKDVKEYYENKPPVTGKDLGLDKTRQKLVQVNKETQPTPDL